MSSVGSQFLRSVDYVRCRIEETPRLILVCGGARGDVAAPPRTVRDAFLRYLENDHPDLHSRVRLAEEFEMLFTKGSAYSNLLEFEADVAALCDVLPLFLEGQGSLAELGAFAYDQELVRKTIVFVRPQILDKPSFIRDGPLERLKDQDLESVCSYPWKILSVHEDYPSVGPIDPADISDYLPEMVEDVRKRLQVLPKNPVLRIDEKAHHLLLLIELVHLFTLSKQKEIGYYLKTIGIQLEDKQVRRYLFLLKSIGFVEQYQYGSDQYYLAKTDKLPNRLISFSFKKNSYKKFEFLREKQRIVDDYKKHDRKKYRAWSKYLETSNG